MANNFNADTTDGLKILADTSGTFNFQSAGTTVTSITANGIDITGDLTVDTNTLYVDSTNNRIGIGTTSPSVDLEIGTNSTTPAVNINSATNGGYVSLKNNSSVTANPLLEFQRWSGSGSLYYGSQIEQDNQDLIFSNVSTAAEIGSQTFTERMRIDSAGNVGIGVDPLHRFHVEGGNMYLDTAGYSQIYQRDSATRDFIALHDETGTRQWGLFHTSDDHLRIDRTSTGQWVKGVPMCFQGERSGSAAVNAYFAFGNGAQDGQGAVMPFAGRIIAATISKTGGTTAGTFRLYINGTLNTGADITTGTGTSSASAGTGLNISFSANDRINWRCSVACSGTTILAYWVIFE